MSRGRNIDGVHYVEPLQADAYRASGAWLWLTIGEALRQAAREIPDKPFIVTSHSSLSFDEVDARSESLAAALQDIGLNPGDRALFQVGTVPELALAIFGCLKSGIVPVCTLPQFREIEITQIGALSGARAYFVQADVNPNFNQVAFARRLLAPKTAATHLVVLRGEAGPGEFNFEWMCTRFDRDEARRRIVPARDPHPEDVAFFQLSGGSTGTPKIIPRMHAEYLGEAASWNRRHHLTQDDTCLWALPLIHNAGMILMLMPCLLGRRTLILQERFDVVDFLEAIARHRVTYTGSIGPIAPCVIDFTEIGKYDLSSLRILFTLSRADALEAHVGIPSQNVFGITEGMLMASEPQANLWARHGTVGWPTGIGAQTRVAGPDGSDLGDGKTGEFCFLGPHTTRGYFNAPAETASSFTEDGFFRTGDLVRSVTIDGIRHFIFEGRLKDNINRGGEKFGAEEVESLIGRHPAIADARVVSMPCPIYGERACAFVVLRSGGQAPKVGELATFLHQLGLAKYKCPERIEVIDTIPVTRVGKVDKAALRARITEILAADAEGGPSKVA
jgi:non-ribosomal peptide synthetase component E (peptide arylation enzyme)